MKHIITFIAILSLMASCLDESPRTALNEEQAYGTPTLLLTNAVGNLYNYIGGSENSQGLQGTIRGVYDYNTFSTDEAMIPIRGGDWYDGGFWENLYRHSWTQDDQSLNDTWNYLYQVVGLCNSSLATLAKYKTLLTDGQYNAATAEVRALRAMYYAYLMDMYGRVPLVVSDSATVAGCRQVERSQMCKFVTQELQAAEPLLADARSNTQGDWYGRMTKHVAWFLMAKIALNAEVYMDDDWTDGNHPKGENIMFNVDGKSLNAWQTCIAYVDKLTAAGYKLEADYQANFAVHNESSTENIFVIPMDTHLYGNQFWYLFRSRHYNHGSAIGQDAENGPCATITAVRANGYGTALEDPRYRINYFSDTLKIDGSVVRLDNGNPLVYQPLEVKLNLTGSEYVQTAGARMRKYERDKNAILDGKLQSNDIVLFRYADALLMEAEAKIRNGGSGQQELDMVRQRAGMPTAEATLKNILRERLVELAWEGWRRNDMVRFGVFGQAYDQRTPLDGEESGYTTVFPIPSGYISMNGNMTQNKGYAEQ